MKNVGSLSIGPHGDREIVMTRTFDAPRGLVYDACTKPELIRRWLLGPSGWSMPVCEVDFHVGGKFRFVWKHDVNGSEMGMGGVYREIVRPERIVSTEQFDDPWYPGGMLMTSVFTEHQGRTTLTQTMVYDTREARDGVLRSRMETGVAESFDRLAQILDGTAPARS